MICLLSMVAWCVGLPASKFLLADIPPVALTALRMLVAGVMLVLIWWAVEGGTVVRRANWWQGLIVGTVSMGIGGLGVVVALDLTDAVTVAIVTATMPIVGLALEVVLDRRRMTFMLLAGLALGLVGGIIALDIGSATPSLGWGAVASFVAVLGFSWGSRATVTRFPDLTPLGRTAITVLGAGIAIGGLAALQGLWQGTGVRWNALGWPHISALFFSAIVAVVVAQTLWIVSVGQIGVGIASLHSNATPFYVMLITLALGGTWNWVQAAGAAIVILGVLVAQGMFARWTG
jgi:drug/metabolite transporter (DMT)-like permease